jgi:hypothetical protein
MGSAVQSAEVPKENQNDRLVRPEIAETMNGAGCVRQPDLF